METNLKLIVSLTVFLILIFLRILHLHILTQAQAA